MDEHMMEEEVRQCCICMEETLMSESEEGDWVSPCRCRGTVGWVHQRCVRRWVLRLEQSSYAVPACAQCLTPYRLHPPKRWGVAVLQLWYEGLYPCVRFWAGCAVAGAFVETGFTLIGIVAVMQVYGVEAAFEMIDEAPPLEASTSVYLVGASVTALGLIPFSDLLLDGLRAASRMPLLGQVLPADVPHPRRRYEPRRRPHIARRLVATALLPSCASLVGQALFGHVDSAGHRALLGGAVFLAVRCGLAMYLRQQLMLRRCRLVVRDYDEE